ncbi:electron transfer flavoprotein subunit alpha/FixB family protein [Nesterenkonia alkaliphila]|uniref:Electron transfer flavoprotein subunit alpha/FixB family protein n=1 Tax=Nesterenkonia alkaliphila TaxID=1463631 RepID=A0A7K1UEQ2_9MICC|nr:electron transfer flavoprotein subunit alpha/FixB family protein [Nesterenkonia alkaliphila]MVT24938.1 electron transfer flavoprotein subunit alpha/FixB family protein [Nesterenkonia alkaliphila]GFZ86823.1 electron transfer flavoprotein subunit alpha [Nesterenkonia alkaliphila]
MTQVLVFFERVQEQLTPAQAELLTHADALGEVVVVTGSLPAAGRSGTGQSSTGQPSAAALAVQGVAGVLTGAEPVAAPILPPDPALAELIAAAAGELDPDLILGTDTPDSVDALAAAAVRLQAGLITGATGVTASGAATKTVLAGSWHTTAQISGENAGPLIATLRPNTASQPVPAAKEPDVVELEVAASSAVQVLEESELASSGRPALAEASTVVAFGRGVEGDLSLVEELADELNAALGASRVATDAGWIDHSAQVGQTGVTVSPQLYLSVGISGAVQQKAGMQTSGTIVAINKDEDAPVFEIADLGVVGDLNEVLPQLIEEIRARKG